MEKKMENKISDSKLFVERVSIIPSLVCNLNCKLCAARVPYLKVKKTLPINRLKEVTERYFEIVDSVFRLSISGGEPLLYKDLSIYLEYLENFLSKINEVEIYTNGTIIPSNGIIEVIKRNKHKYFFRIDNYGQSVSTKAYQVKEILSENEIKYDLRDYYSENCHCGGWVDYGDPKTVKHSIEEAYILYSKCACPQKLHFSFCIIDGIMTPCDMVHNRMELGLSISENEYVNLFDPSLSDEEIRKKIKRLQNGNYLDSCRYCNGMCDDSIRFRPGEQIKQHN